MNRRRMTLRDAYDALQQLCTGYREDAEHFQREHAKQFTRAIDLQQRHALVLEMNALHRLQIDDLQSQLARLTAAHAPTLSQDTKP